MCRYYTENGSARWQLTGSLGVLLLYVLIHVRTVLRVGKPSCYNYTASVHFCLCIYFQTNFTQRSFKCINSKLINCLVNKNKVSNFAGLHKFMCLCFVVRPLRAWIYERISKFLHAVIPECKVGATLFDWLTRVGGRAQTHVSYRGRSGS